jgi:hypothetical protein
MVRLLVEEACNALPLPNPAQRERDDRFLDLFYLNRRRPSRAAGSFFDPKQDLRSVSSYVLGTGWAKALMRGKPIVG